MCDKVFKNGPSEICGRQPLKNLNRYDLLNYFKYFKGCLPQISRGPFLNTLSPVFYIKLPHRILIFFTIYLWNVTDS